MINAEKLLGGLLGGAGSLGGLGQLGGIGDLGRGSMPGKMAMGMGLLGVAMAAFEHFAEQKGAGGQPAAGPAGFPPPAPGSLSGRTPPPPPGGMPPSPPSGNMPPSPPSAGVQAGPPVPPPAAQADPVLLIRAMIAAANADGVLDDTERMRILGQLEGLGLTEEEKDFLCAEFDAPRSLEEIAVEVTGPSVAAQVYTVSLLAIDVDTPEEREYLEALRTALNLTDEQARSIARRLGRG